MKILIVSHYFWPENFRINDLAQGLVGRGHSVSVLTGIPNYPKGKFYGGYSFAKVAKQKFGEITIYRSPVIPRGRGSSIRLSLNYISMAFFASLRILFVREKFDKILVFGASPITIGIPAIVAKHKFKAPIFFWVQDLWPDSLIDAGGISNRSVISLVDKITRFIYRSSHKILVQSKAFIPYIQTQGVRANKMMYLPNSAESFYKKVGTTDRFLELIPKDGPVLMFAGNIGEAQGFDTIINSAIILKQKKIKVNWVIIGEGRQKKSIIRRIENEGLEKSFFFLGSFPSEDMPDFFIHADALLVTLKKSLIFSKTIPSKVQSYLACSKPILASLDGEGGRIISEAGCGLVSPSEDSVSFSESIVEFLGLPSNQKIKMGVNGRLYFEKEFDGEKQLDRLIMMMNS